MNNERMIAVSSDLIERAVSLLDLLPESGTIIELRAALATQPAEKLWAVHAQGPDDLFAAFSREDAEAHAAAFNFLPCPPGISVSAVVIESPWPAAEHWKYLAEQWKYLADKEQESNSPPAAAHVAAGEPVAWIVVEEPFHGVQGIQSGEWDIELDAKAIESLAQGNSPGRIALFTAAPPAATHGDEAVRKMVLPERIDRKQYLGGRGDAVAQGWNDCLNWIDKANAMRAQAGEGEDHA